MNEKKYSLLNNVFFLLRMIRKYLPMSFVFVIIDIPLAVFMDYVGVRIPNLIVGMIQGYSVSVGMVAALGIASVLAAVTLQYGNRMVSAQAPQLCAKLDLKLFEKYMTCSYEKLEDADFTAHYKEADGYLADDNHFLSEAAMHIIEIGSGALGIILYFSILIRLPKWVLAVLITGTIVELLISRNAENERKKRQETIGRLTRKADYMNKTAADVRSAKDIRIFGMIPWLEEKFTAVLDRFHIENTQVEKQRIRIAGIRAGISGVLEILTGILLAVFVLQEKLSLAEYILYVGAIRSFSMWSFQFGTLMQNFYRMNGDLSRIRSFIDGEETIQLNTQTQVNKQSNRSIVNTTGMKFDHVSKIEFLHVFYRYPKSDRWIVKDLSFVIEDGEKIALVGMNGAGKTTMIKLLCGLLIPTKGTIRINGVSSTDISREDYYRLFSTVFQDIHLFPASIQRNIVCSDEQIDPIRFDDAVKKSGMDQVAQKFRDGLNTLLVAEVDADAVNLSGGQVQKLMLARAIYKNAPILLLDEPTAALDPIAEKNIYLQYNEMAEGKVSVFISHRLASTVFCDRIFFMKNGIIAEEGTHEELIQKKGDYYEAFSVQSKYYQEEEEEAQ
ncbi:MAG: ABC transporter ATP-binding protein [Lachnospiraceae bacterium]